MKEILGGVLGLLVGCGIVLFIFSRPTQERYDAVYYTTLGQCIQAPPSPLQTFEEVYKACDAVAKTRRDHERRRSSRSP